jgi:phosphohistidine phosphatase
MEFYLLRHGAAVEPGTKGYEVDANRPLVAKGRKQIRHVVGALKEMDVRFDAIFTSPLLRARETAELLAAGMKSSRLIQIVDELIPGTPPEKLIRRIIGMKKMPKRILCVGHEPDLGELASWLLTGAASGRFPLKKGGLVRLDISKLTPGQCAVLTWCLTPPQLKMLSGK